MLTDQAWDVAGPKKLIKPHPGQSLLGVWASPSLKYDVCMVIYDCNEHKSNENTRLYVFIFTAPPIY